MPPVLWLPCASWPQHSGRFTLKYIEDMRSYCSDSRTIFEAVLCIYLSNGELNANTGPASYDLTDITRQLLCNLFQDVHDIFTSRLVIALMTLLPFSECSNSFWVYPGNQHMLKSNRIFTGAIFLQSNWQSLCWDARVIAYGLTHIWEPTLVTALFKNPA